MIVAPRATAEQAEHLTQAAGFTVAHRDRADSARMAGSRDELDAIAQEKANPAHWTEGEPPDSPRLRQLQKARDNDPLIQQARAMAKEWHAREAIEQSKIAEQNQLPKPEPGQQETREERLARWKAKGRKK